MFLSRHAPNLLALLLAGLSNAASAMYVGGNPVSYVDPRGLATQSDIAIGLSVIKNYAPELYPVAPTSVIPVRALSNWMGMPIQGVTDLRNKIQITADIYGDCNTPVDPLMVPYFLQTIAHEWQHVQQRPFERLLTHGELHEQIDTNTEIIAGRVTNEFNRRRKLTPQDAACTCPK